MPSMLSVKGAGSVRKATRSTNCWGGVIVGAVLACTTVLVFIRLFPSKYAPMSVHCSLQSGFAVRAASRIFGGSAHRSSPASLPRQRLARPCRVDYIAHRRDHQRRIFPVDAVVAARYDG